MVGMVNYVKYSYGSNKGSAQAGTTFASPLAYQGSNMNYTSNVIKDEFLVGSETEYTGTLSWLPVRPGTVKITVDGKTIVDDGNGKLTSADTELLDAGSEVNYTTGKYTVKFKTAPAQTPTADYIYDNELVPAQVPELQLSIESLPIQTQSRKLKALYSFDASYELSKELTA